MKTKLIFIIILILSTVFDSFSQSLVNKGSNIEVSDESKLVIKGNFKNTENAKVRNSGTIALTGDWINNTSGGELMKGDADIEDWESANMNQYNWVTGGDGNWEIHDGPRYEGSYALRSPDISDNQSVWFELQYEVVKSDDISFYFLVSTEPNFDYLRFYIDGSMYDSWSGINDWTKAEFNVTPGIHTFRWEYDKDASISSNWDECYVDLIKFPGKEYSSTGLVKFNGSTTQEIQGTVPSWFNRIILESNVNLLNNISVSEELTFSSARVYLGYWNLYMSPSAQFYGVDPVNSYVETDLAGYGYLFREVGSTPVLFPVGSSGTYSPITLTNSGVIDEFSVLVFSDVITYGNDGETIPEIDDCVNKTWLVWEDVSGGSDLDVMVQWDVIDEGNTFDRNNCAIGINQAEWTGDIATAAPGNNPYSLSRSGITDARPLAVGDLDSPMAILAIISIQADLMVYLEGPYNGIEMQASLNPELLPLNQPYNIEPWLYPGTESVTAIPDTEIVDWVLVEFRDASSAENATEATIVNQQAAFLLKDGSVVALDGFSKLQLISSISEDLFTVIRHRNHIDIISSNPMTEENGIYSYNFTTAIDKVHGGSDGYKEIASGIYGMAGGDPNADGMVDNTDKSNWALKAGKTDYLPEDQNMDGQVNNQDKNNIWINNTDKSVQIPD